MRYVGERNSTTVPAYERYRARARARGADATYHSRAGNPISVYDTREVNDMANQTQDVDYDQEVRKMKAQGKTITPQGKHRGNKAGHWEPDEQTKQRLGDAYGITKEIIEEP